tara:strand:- start:5385 stop:6650 length:1266 start_codon:yes stop_codon:yes gene_type:complete
MPRNGSGTYTLPAGNPTIPGTVISSGGWWNPTSNDLASAITQSIASDGQTVPTADLPMGNFKHTAVGNANQRNQYPSYGQVQDGQPQWMTVTGTDTILGTIAPGPTTYTAGQVFRFVPAGANTTNAVTLNINSLGAKSITKNGTSPLAPGDLAGGTVIEVIYDGTRFQLMAGGSVLTGHGQCRLSVTSATTLRLSPYNGSSLIIGGATQQVPSAGVSYTLSGLAASTLYYVYAFMNSGVMTLEVVATGHSTATNGVEVKTGDSTRTLVGMVFTTGSTQFADGAANRLCANWFNRRSLLSRANFTAPRSTASGTPVELNSEIRNSFVCWGDESTNFQCWGSVTISGAAGTQANTYIGVDSTTLQFDGTITYQRDANSNIGTAAFSSGGTLSEGFHFSTILGTQSGTSTAWSTNYVLETLIRA